MDWKVISTIVTLCTIQAGILLAASKSIFVVKKQIYDEYGIPHYVTRKELEGKNTLYYNDVSKISKKMDEIISIIVPRPEWEASKKERALRYTTQQENLHTQIEELIKSNAEMRKGQIEIGKALVELQTLIKKVNKGYL